MSGTSIAIQEVAADCVQTIHAVTQAAYLEYEKTTPSSALLETPQDIATDMSARGVRVAICQFGESGAVVGSVRFRVNDGNLDFFRLAVVPHARGRGLADALLHWLEVTAEREGVTALTCSVRMEVARNVRLYLRRGYRLATERWVTAIDGSRLRVGALVKTLVQQDCAPLV